MTKKKQNYGKIFEKTFEDSISETTNWFFRVRDVNPAALKKRFNIPRNPYDLLVFDGKYLFTLELKSNQGKTISHRGSNPQIKPHQVEALIKASEHKNIISGFILNYRSVNKTFFLSIEEFIKYDKVTKGELEDTYKNKKNEKSIPVAICEEIGIEIPAVKKRVHNRYFINDFMDQAIRKYNTEGEFHANNEG